MAVSVRIPTILRTYTDGESEVSADGDTLSAVLDDLESNHNGIKARVLDDNGDLRRFVNVYVGNDDVRFLDSLETPTPDGTQVSIIPAVAGGAHDEQAEDAEEEQEPQEGDDKHRGLLTFWDGRPIIDEHGMPTRRPTLKPGEGEK